VSPLTDDDLDRLADYAAGLLDAPAAAEVDRLIATDAGWARAHTVLTAALPLVRGALADLPQEPVPADVAARIDRALERESSGTASKVIDLGKARRWRRAALATTAVAAAVAACVGGLVALNGQQRFGSTASTSAGEGKAVAPREAQGLTAAPPTRASGTNYTHDLLGHSPALSNRAPNAAGAPEPSGQATHGSVGSDAAGPAFDAAAVPAELVRLVDPAQLRACLDAIVQVEGGRAVAVDYARYRGAPALIVTLVGGRVAAVAAGPSCGLPDAGAAIVDSGS
jgi:hypothetical protein